MFNLLIFGQISHSTVLVGDAPILLVVLKVQLQVILCIPLQHEMGDLIWTAADWIQVLMAVLYDQLPLSACANGGVGYTVSVLCVHCSSPRIREANWYFCSSPSLWQFEIVHLQVHS